VAKSYSRYCSAPANVALSPGVQPVCSTKSSRYARVAARDSSVSSAAVRQTEKKADGVQAKGGVMPFRPLDQRMLVMAGVDRSAEDHGVIVRRRRVGLIRTELVQVDGRAIVLEHRGDARGDLGGVAVGAGVEDEDACHVTSLAGRARAHRREIPQQIALKRLQALQGDPQPDDRVFTIPERAVDRAAEQAKARAADASRAPRVVRADRQAPTRRVERAVARVGSPALKARADLPCR